MTVRGQQKLGYLHGHLLFLYVLHSLHATPSSHRARSDPERPAENSLASLLRNTEVKSEMSDPVTSQSQHTTSPYFRRHEKHLVNATKKHYRSVNTCPYLWSASVCVTVRMNSSSSAIYLLWRASVSVELSWPGTPPPQASPQGANVSTSEGSATLLTWAAWALLLT